MLAGIYAVLMLLTGWGNIQKGRFFKRNLIPNLEQYLSVMRPEKKDGQQVDSLKERLCLVAPQSKQVLSRPSDTMCPHSKHWSVITYWYMGIYPQQHCCCDPRLHAAQVLMPWCEIHRFKPHMVFCTDNDKTCLATCSGSS